MQHDELWKMGSSWDEDVIATACGASMPVRVYRGARLKAAPPLVLHLHGGAFVGGSLAEGRTVSTLLAESGAVVVSAGYPTGREHAFPEAIEAAYGVLDALTRHRGDWAARRSAVFVAGEECGGNLAAGLALIARDRQAPALAGQILLSPMLDPELATASIRAAEAGSAGCPLAAGWQCYLGRPDHASHPYAAPSTASRLAGVAPALVVTAADDPLRDESLRYAQRLRDCGVDVEQHLLAAPTDWPAALGRGIEAMSDWADQLRRICTDFFARAGTLRPARA